MSANLVYTGIVADDGTGDPLRVAFTKINGDMVELYSNVANLWANLDSFILATQTLDGVIYDQVGKSNDLSNASHNMAGYASNTANLTFAISNTVLSAWNLANVAYDFANTTVTRTSAIYNLTNASFDVANAAFGLANTVGPIAAGIVSNVTASFDRANSAYYLADEAYSLANAAEFWALSGIANAAAAYNFANGVSANTTAAYRVANSAYVVTNSSFGTTNAVYFKTNSAYAVANAGFDRANGAFAWANTKLANANGTVFAGSLVVPNTVIGGSIGYKSNAFWGTSNGIYVYYGYTAQPRTNSVYRAEALTGTGYSAFTESGNGVYAVSNTGPGISAYSNTGYGGYFYSSGGTPLWVGALVKSDANTEVVLERMSVTNTGILCFDSGYGYSAPAYGVRAWVNFDGTVGLPSLADLSFVANGSNNVMRIYITDPANNDIDVGSSVALLGTGNGTRYTYPAHAYSAIFASYLAVGNQNSYTPRDYVVQTVNQADGWFEVPYSSPGYGYWSTWFFWWWYWYYIYGWYVPSGYTFEGTLSIYRSKIRAAGGVSSINDLGSGRYQVNFSFQMPDSNYVVTGSASNPEAYGYDWRVSSTLGVRSQHSTFCEVSANHHWGGTGYWRLGFWWWWYWIWVPNYGTVTGPSKFLHVAIIR